MSLVSKKVQDVITERSKRYGPPKESFERLAMIWTGLIEAHYGIKLPHPLESRLVCGMTAAWKILRMATNYSDDSALDAAAFIEFAYKTNHRDHEQTTKRRPRPRHQHHQQGKVAVVSRVPKG